MALLLNYKSVRKFGFFLFLQSYQLFEHMIIREYEGPSATLANNFFKKESGVFKNLFCCCFQNLSFRVGFLYVMCAVKLATLGSY